MKKFIIGLFVIGLTSPVLAQVPKVEQLSEVVVTAVNYKYLNAIDSKEVAVPVKMLNVKLLRTTYRKLIFTKMTTPFIMFHSIFQKEK